MYNISVMYYSLVLVEICDVVQVLVAFAFLHLATGRWISPGTPVFFIKTDCRDITELLLKVALDTLNQPTIHSLDSAKFH